MLRGGFAALPLLFGGLSRQFLKRWFPVNLGGTDNPQKLDRVHEVHPLIMGYVAAMIFGFALILGLTYQVEPFPLAI